MGTARRTLLCISLGLAASACAQKDPAYERAMEDWANRHCDCIRAGIEDYAECRGKITEPTFAHHWADAAIDNPNYEISSKFDEQVRQCEKHSAPMPTF
jgi:hypothetical protein